MLELAPLPASRGPAGSAPLVAGEGEAAGAVGEGLSEGVPEEVGAEAAVGEAPTGGAVVTGAGSTTVSLLVSEPSSRLQRYSTLSGPTPYGSTSEEPATVTA